MCQNWKSSGKSHWLCLCFFSKTDKQYNMCLRNMRLPWDELNISFMESMVDVWSHSVISISCIRKPACSYGWKTLIKYYLHKSDWYPLLKMFVRISLCIWDSYALLLNSMLLTLIIGWNMIYNCSYSLLKDCSINYRFSK